MSVSSLQWVLDKQDLLKERQKDLKFLTEEEYWKLQIFFANGTEFSSSCGRIARRGVVLMSQWKRGGS